MVLVKRKKPVNKVKLFRGFTGLNRVRNYVGQIEVENLIWKPHEKHTSVVSNSGYLKKYLKKKVLSCYYKEVGKRK